jgi:hypothetical protein
MTDTDLRVAESFERIFPAPPAGSIVHYRSTHILPTDAGCALGANEIWIDQTPPRTYRALLTDCLSQTREFGGALDTQEILELLPPDTLFVPDVKIDLEPDPAEGLREAIRDGRAHDEGRTELDGRTAKRMRLDCPPDAPCEGRSRVTRLPARARSRRTRPDRFRAGRRR